MGKKELVPARAIFVQEYIAHNIIFVIYMQYIGDIGKHFHARTHTHSTSHSRQ